MNRSGPSNPNLVELCQCAAHRAAAVRLTLASLTGDKRNALLHAMADGLRAAMTEIISANQRDLADNPDLTDAMKDRLMLDEARIESMATAVDLIAEQRDPVGDVVEGRVLPNGIRIEKRRVPLGVVLVIYESRPNVTSDAAALCFKSGNAIILKGGREAANSNRAIVAALRAALAAEKLEDAITFVDTTEREALPILLRMKGVIDLAIPRGGPGLMKVVTEAAQIPVVKHDAGNCHLYIDQHLDDLVDAAVSIAVNAKTQRPGVCNAIETLLIHDAAASDVLPLIGAQLQERGVELRTDDRARAILGFGTPATESDWAEEYLSLTLAVRVVDSLEQACEHIRAFGSHHTEAIVTSSVISANAFFASIDSANVMVNCSTRFADGSQYGLGAEIGISTDKLHARGPMGAQDLTTYQWVLSGAGQIRS